MGFFDRIRSFFSGQPVQERYLHVYIYSRRCRDAVAGRIDLMNELSGADVDNASGTLDGAEEAAGAPAGAVWFVRKVFTTSGRDRCFDNVELRLWLDGNKQVLRHEVDGGMWLERDEYERLERARASTLEDDNPGGGSASDIDETEKPGGNPNPR
jgi:hypothetical protein